MKTLRKTIYLLCRQLHQTLALEKKEPLSRRLILYIYSVGVISAPKNISLYKDCISFVDCLDDRFDPDDSRCKHNVDELRLSVVVEVEM